MLSLHRTLSLRYLSRRWFRALLIVASIMLGVATLVATQALSDTMTKAALASSNPVAGTLDFIVTNGELNVDRALAKEIAVVPGVKQVRIGIFDQAHIIIGKTKHQVLLKGIELTGGEKELDEFAEQLELDPKAQKMLAKMTEPAEGEKLEHKLDIKQLEKAFNEDYAGYFLAIVGKEVDAVLKDEPDLPLIGLKVLNIEKAVLTGIKKHKLLRVASVAPKSDGIMSALGGHVVIVGIDNAAAILGLPEGMARRLDVALHRGHDPKKALAAIKAVVGSRATVRTIEEQNQALQSAMDGMKTGFSMCGIAALIVGMFLVYNSLAVGVAERRHEIGILLAVGATRDQIWRLFAGEALVLGTVGSVLGIPLGVGMAYLGLRPMQQAISDIFSAVNLRQIELSWELATLAFVVGILSSLIASVIPAVRAAYDKPADAVRKVPREPDVSHVILHIGATVLLIAGGAGMIFLREHLHTKRWGTYGGLGLVMVGTLLAAPLFAHLAARALVPIARRFFSIEWRLAADNLVRSPGRTGLVIGALAAGVCLVVETAGIIRSNRIAILDWVDTSIAADLIITSGSPVGSGGQTNPMHEDIGAELRKLPEVENAIPIRQVTEIPFRDKRISILTTIADQAYAIEKKRLTKRHDIEFYKLLADEPNAVIISENFAALHHFRQGDIITLNSPQGEVRLHVVGVIVDYSWNQGVLIMNRDDYVKHWRDPTVTIFDVFLQPGADPNQVKDKIAKQLGAQYDLHPLTRVELKTRIIEMIDRLYSVAYAQQIVVMLVAALGVVMALLISVLQRRREMGLLRAIGASQAQVVYLVLSEAILMGIFGTVIGAMLAVPLQWYALQVVFLEESGYVFPVYLPYVEAMFIALMAMAIAVLAGVGPALFAVRERIPEAIAYE